MPLNLDPFSSQKDHLRRGRGGEDVQPFRKDEEYAKGEIMKVKGIGKAIREQEEHSRRGPRELVDGMAHVQI